MKPALYRLTLILTLVAAACGFSGCTSTKFAKLIPDISAENLEIDVAGRFTKTKVTTTNQVDHGDHVTADTLEVSHDNPWVNFRLKATKWIRRKLGVATDPVPAVAPPPPPSSPAPAPRRPGKRKKRAKEPPRADTPNRAGALPRRGTHPFRGEPVVSV